MMKEPCRLYYHREWGSNTSLGRNLKSTLLFLPYEAKMISYIYNWILQLQNLNLKVFFIGPF